jgi:hypothetical protein
MGSLRIAPDVVCFSTMLSGTNGLTSLALMAHGARATAASNMLAITRTRDPFAPSIPVLPLAARCGHDEAISGQLLECLADSGDPSRTDISNLQFAPTLTMPAKRMSYRDKPAIANSLSNVS